MAVQEKITSLWRHTCRNVLEMKALPAEFEIQRQRPIHAFVAIPAHDADLCRQGLQRSQQRWPADIPEMPDFISTGDRLADVVGQAIVRIRDDGYGFSILDCVIRLAAGTLNQPIRLCTEPRTGWSDMGPGAFERSWRNRSHAYCPSKKNPASRPSEVPAIQNRKFRKSRHRPVVDCTA